MENKTKYIIGASIAGVVIITTVAIIIYNNKKKSAAAWRCSGKTGQELQNCLDIFAGMSLSEIKNTPVVGTKKPAAK